MDIAEVVDTMELGDAFPYLKIVYTSLHIFETLNFPLTLKNVIEVLL